MDSTLYQIKHNFLSPALVLETLVTILISKHLLITGLIKIEFIINMKVILEELNFILSVPFIMLVCWISLDFTQLPPLVDLMDGQDMIEIHTCKLIFLSYHQERLFKLSGMEHQFLSEDWLLNKWNKRTSIQLIQYWIKVHKLYWHQLVDQQYWYVRQFVLIWVVFQFHIWVTIMVMCVFVMVQYMINLVELDKDQHYKTYHILITRFMRVVHWYVLRHWNSQESHQLDFGHDLIINIIHNFFT